MCIDPATMAAISIATTLASTAASAAGAVYQGQAQAASYKAAANAAAIEAAGEREAGAYASARQDERNRALTGQQVTAVAASGVDLYGSPTTVIADARTEGELDKMAIRRNAQVKSDFSLYEAKANRANAKSARTAGYVGAIAPVLTGVSSSFDTAAKIKSGYYKSS